MQLAKDSSIRKMIFMVLAFGVLAAILALPTPEDIVNNGDGTHTYKWHSRYPIAHYLLSLAITNYYEYIQYFNYSPTDSMLVIHYIYPEHFNGFQQQLDETIPMLEIFSDRFGLYPFIDEKYGHAEFLWQFNCIQHHH